MTEGFAIIPNWLIRDTEVSIHALAVYAVLSSRADKAGVSWPSISTIAKEARCSDNTVKKAIEELRDSGVLSWETRREGTRNLSNRYRLNLSTVTPEGVGQEVTHPPVDPGVDQGVTQGGSPGGQEQEPVKKNQRTRITSSGVVQIDELSPTPEQQFDAAWAMWPKKTDKKLSREKFLRALPKRPTLAGDVARFGVAYAQTTETQFVPALAVWIGRERWDDDLPVARGQRPTTVDSGRLADQILRERAAQSARVVDDYVAKAIAS